jgi:putative transcriptional regulator
MLPGKYDPSLPLAFRMARLFGLRIEEIFEEDGNGQAS